MGAEKMKKMFVLFLKFKSYYMKHKAMEKMAEEKKEKAKKQFKMFQELCEFAKKAEAKKEMVEKKMKGKFMAFKMCLVKGKCEKGSGSDSESESASMESSESHESSEESGEMKKKMEMMKKLKMKMMKGSESEEESSEESSEESEEESGEKVKKRMELFEKMKMMMKKMKAKSGDSSESESEESEESSEESGEKHSAMEAMMSHLMESKNGGFWAEGKDEMEKKMKKMFMMKKAMAFLKKMKDSMESEEESKESEMASKESELASKESELASKESAEAKDKFSKFVEMMKHMEKASKMKEEFHEFVTWKMQKGKKEKMEREKEEKENAPVFTYFDIRGRGEVTRLLIAAGKLNIKERRVNGTEWATLKPTMPYGQLPVLNMSGHVFTQSIAIQNFVAKKAGLYPRHKLSQLMTDQIANARDDLFRIEGAAALNNDTLKQAELDDKVMKAYPLYFGNFNKYIENNPAQSGFVCGDELSLADIIIFEGTQTAYQNNPDILKDYPWVRALRVKVAATEGILKYVVKRGNYPI